MADELTITLDLDWAPDFAIEDAARVLLAHGVRATWFVTHDTPVLDLLRAHADVFELGIHPNFHPGSSHGATPAAVLATCMGMVPEARAVRTHDLVQSTTLLREILTLTPITTDVSQLALGGRGLRGFEMPLGSKRLLRLPYRWEDDLEMDQPRPCWEAANQLEGAGNGLAILDFHPIHVALNSANMAPYGALKARAPRLQAASRALCTELANPGPGAGSLFRDLVARLAGRETLRISDLARRERERQP